MADLANGANGVLEGHVSHDDTRLLQHAQQDRACANLEVVGVLVHVRVADDHVQPAVSLGVGVGFVAGIDDGARARRCARDALPDVLGPLADAEHRATCCLEDLSGACVDLSADQERDQYFGIAAEVVLTGGAVILVTAVGVAGRVGVVLEQVDLAPDALFAQPLLGAGEKLLENAFTGFVVRHQVVDGVALGRGVLGVRAHIEVQAGAIGEKDVAAPPPRHHASEEIAGNFVGAEPALAAKSAGDPVLVLDPEYAALHVTNVPGRPSDGLILIRR